MKIAFFGTPELAVATLTRLVEGRHEVVAVVTQPDRGRGRGRKRQPSHVARAALTAGLEPMRVEKVGAPESVEALRTCEPDLGVVVAFGQFIPRLVRELPALGYLINAHASLLPRHRGAAPIAHAILEGDERTGISVMRVERAMDAGPVSAMHETPIGEHETAGALTERLAVLAADAIAAAVDEIEGGAVRWQPQDEAAATLAPKIGREDARLDWSQDALALSRRVRAMSPSPGAFTSLSGEPLRILEARPDASGDTTGAAPGTFVRGSDPLRIATGRGWLVPLLLQRPGRRVLNIESFLRGHAIENGARAE